jgi:hypothetical protein
MKIMHRVAFVATQSERQGLATVGVDLTTTAMPGTGDPFVAFDIAEDDPRWPAVVTLLKRWGRYEGQVSTVFTKKEVESASWLQIGAWHHGYPQPDEDIFGYRQATYDLLEWCETCGVGMRQNAPFQMRGEPKWGRNAIMQLLWVNGELFVKPEIWARIFKPMLIDYRPVLSTEGDALKTVVQLVVPTTANIVTNGLSTESCRSCGRLKYLPVVRGAFPPLTEKPTVQAVRTVEYFGSGAQADQLVLVSRDVARALTAGGIRGASLKPVAG